MRYIALTTLAILSTYVGNILAQGAQPLPAGKPNVIVVLADDQGYGDMSCNGNTILQTPNMDRLAREGVNFTDFHMNSYCNPTRASLMTGRYAHRVGGWMTVNGRNMPRLEEVTMAEVFRHNGYHTGHFGKWQLGANYPYRAVDRGFDEDLCYGDGGNACANDYWGNDRVNDRYMHNGIWEDKPRAGFDDDVFFDATMDYVRKQKADGKPFFIYLAPYNPHFHCTVPSQDWAAPYIGKVSKHVAYIYATVARMDLNLGRLRQFLKDEGLTDNTLLLYSSDNGAAATTAVFNAGMRGHKGEAYEGGHREPCFLYWPDGGFNKPQTVHRLANVTDILPTLADLCHLTLPQPIQFDGVSLKPLMENPEASWPDRTVVMDFTTADNHVGANPGPPKFGLGAVMTERWRLVDNRELYDMTADPGQKSDVASNHPGVVRKLRADYQQYWNSVSARDADVQGRPVIGSAQAPDVELCGEDWYTTKGHVLVMQPDVSAGGADFGRWPVRVATAATYHIELRRWPRAINTSLTGLPPIKDKSEVDAWLDGDQVLDIVAPHNKYTRKWRCRSPKPN